MSKIKIKPKAGTRVLDPTTTPPSPLPQEGKEVERNTYWLRRLQDGSVVEVSKILKKKEG
ncbi:MAG: DUF2635 domain-containing protein [Alphaproteobacteria bacterium]